MNDVQACHVFCYLFLGTAHGREGKNGRGVKMERARSAKRSGRTTRIGGRAGVCSKGNVGDSVASAEGHRVINGAPAADIHSSLLRCVCRPTLDQR